MAWTAPRTWVTAEVVTAAQMNTHIRDNLLETAAATATTAGDLVYADAANSMGSRVGIGAAGAFLVSTGSAPAWRTTAGALGDATYTSTTPAGPTSFVDLSDALWTSGTTVAVTVTTGTQALVWWGDRQSQHGTAGSNVQLTYRISGATTVAASTAWGTLAESDPAGTFTQSGRAHYRTGLTGGSNTFTLQALVSTTAAAATIGSPYLAVMGL